MFAHRITHAVLPAVMITIGMSAAPARGEERFDLDETYDVSRTGTIELRTRDADVTIVGADRDDVHVEIHYRRDATGLDLGGGSFRVEVSESGGDLRIEEVARRRVAWSAGHSTERYEVLIEAPEGVSLKVRGDDDDYDISGIHGAIVLAADDGKIRLRDCRGSEFDLAFEDGELDMDGGTGSLRLRFDDGDAQIRGATFDRIDAHGNDGTIHLSGNLAADGRYTFRLDDGDMDLRVGDGGGELSFAFADGSLDLQGGAGSAELSFDDGRARFRGVSFGHLEVRGNDGGFELDGSVPPGADYAIRLDDGDVRFNARDGGGRVSARFDDGPVHANDGFRQVSDAKHRAVLEWGDGDADIEVVVNDGVIRLSAPAAAVSYWYWQHSEDGERYLVL